MTFRNRVISYLGKYKKSVLHIEKPGVFKYRGKVYEKDYILPKRESFQRQNIIEPYRDKFYSDKLSKISFHPYFHHLNSSQAMCINLFYPLIHENILYLITKYLKISEMNVQDQTFEKESTIEKVNGNQRKTNFDFYMKMKSGLSIYFEIKYTENGFGSVKPDENHIIKYKSTYSTLLENNPFIQKEFKKMSSFLKHYQILRNLVHIDISSIVVFLFPRENTQVMKQAKYAKENMLNTKGQELFHIVYLENIIPYLKENQSDNNLIRYYDLFSEKYLSYTV